VHDDPPGPLLPPALALCPWCVDFTSEFDRLLVTSRSAPFLVISPKAAATPSFFVRSNVAQFFRNFEAYHRFVRLFALYLIKDISIHPGVLRNPEYRLHFPQGFSYPLFWIALSLKPDFWGTLGNSFPPFCFAHPDFPSPSTPICFRHTAFAVSPPCAFPPHPFGLS